MQWESGEIRGLSHLERTHVGIYAEGFGATECGEPQCGIGVERVEPPPASPLE